MTAQPLTASDDTPATVPGTGAPRVAARLIIDDGLTAYLLTRPAPDSSWAADIPHGTLLIDDDGEDGPERSYCGPSGLAVTDPAERAEFDQAVEDFTARTEPGCLSFWISGFYQ